MSIEHKIMYGFSNIYVAKKNGDKYATPVLIEGGKSVTVNLNYNYTELKKGKYKTPVRFQEFAGGGGKLKLLGLSKEEYKLLFGCEVEDNKVKIKTTDKAPTLALMFTRKQLDGTEKGYCLYNIVCKPLNFDATTIENGRIAEDSVEIEFFVNSKEEDIYYIEENIDDSFFEQVKF